jgi:hypothetical protein
MEEHQMNRISTIAATMLAFSAIAGPAMAAGVEGRGVLPPKHDSNTLHKLGNAIQYPVRKAGENISVGSHRTVGDNSVVKDQRHASTEVVKPSGNTVVIAKDNPRIGWTSQNRFMHRTRRNFHQEGRKYYWFNDHRYYLDLKTGDRIKID